MTKIDVQNLCDDLDKLLKDICDFLLDKANCENWTETQRFFANKLIQRSKKQLQQISKVSLALSTDVNDEHYVDMNPPAAPEEEIEYEESVEPITCSATPINEPIACPYENLPATELEQCEKFGCLDKKGRFLFIGHQKKLIAGIKGTWLLIYGSKKDPKPVEYLNLCSFEVKPTDGIKTKSFELVCKKTQKSFQFTALTPKDMMQWVAFINLKTGNDIGYDFVEKCLTTGQEENSYELFAETGRNKVETFRKKITKPLPPLPIEPQQSPVPKDDHLITEDEDDSTYSELTAIIVQPIKNSLVNASQKQSKPNIVNEMKSFNETEDSFYDLPEQPATKKILSIEKDPSTNDIKQKGVINQASQPSSNIDEEDVYDIPQQPVSKKPLAQLSEDLLTSNYRPSLIDSRTDSQLTNSFSDDDEDQTYDVPENPSTNKFCPKPTSKYVFQDDKDVHIKDNIDKVTLATKSSVRKLDDFQISEKNYETKILEKDKISLEKDKISLEKCKEVQNVEVEGDEEYINLRKPLDIASWKNTQSKLCLELLESVKLKKVLPPLIKPKPNTMKKK